jgi:hypothetical protein
MQIISPIIPKKFKNLVPEPDPSIKLISRSGSGVGSGASARALARIHSSSDSLLFYISLRPQRYE